MNNNENTKEKICAFYASDYHFEMISLPYIDKKIDNKDEIIILTENNLESSMKTLLAKTNFKKDKAEKILELNWKNDDVEKLKTIQNKIEEEKDIIVFVKGNEKYIKNANHNIERCVPKEKHIKIIDCYDMEEVGENLDEVMDKYHKVLRITGEKEIEKL